MNGETDVFCPMLTFCRTQDSVMHLLLEVSPLESQVANIRVEARVQQAHSGPQFLAGKPPCQSTAQPRAQLYLSAPQAQLGFLPGRTVITITRCLPRTKHLLCARHCAEGLPEMTPHILRRLCEIMKNMHWSLPQRLAQSSRNPCNFLNE